MDKINKILIVRPDALGDMVLTLPCIRVIKKKHPHIKISILASPYNAKIIKNEDYIDEIILDKFKTGEAQGYLGFFKYISFIRNYNFDAVIHFYSETPQVWLTILAGIRYQLGDKAKLGLWPIFRKYGSFLKTFDQTKHVVEYNFQLMRSLGIDLDPEIKLSLSTDQKAEIAGIKILNENGRRETVPLVGVQIGVGFGNRPITPDKYAKFINKLRDDLDVDVCITGNSEKEFKAAGIFKDMVAGSVIDLMGKTSLPELVAVIKSYDVFIGVDTGPFHMAAALGVPQVAIFPSRKVKPTRWAPWRNRHLIIRESQSCDLFCPHEGCAYDICSDNIKIEQMVDKVKRVLAGEGFVRSEDQFRYWFKKAMSILVLYNDKTESSAKKYAGLLKEAGIRVNLMSIKTKNIYSKLIEYDVTIIHNFSKKRKLFLFFWSLMVSLKLFNPPLIVNEEGLVDNVQKIAFEYKKRFEKKRI